MFLLKTELDVSEVFVRDIQRLWKIAGQRYHASQQQLQFCVGSYSIYDDLPTDLNQVGVKLLLHPMHPSSMIVQKWTETWSGTYGQHDLHTFATVWHCNLAILTILQTHLPQAQ